MSLSQSAMEGGDEHEEALSHAQKLQARVREAKQRAQDAKEEEELEKQRATEARKRPCSIVPLRVVCSPGCRDVSQQKGA